MDGLPEISVIVPIYNAKKYIRQCVESILCQDFENFEIVLIDDVSTDGTFELCQSLFGELGNVRLFRHEKNMGQGAARNTGIWKARGRYVTFVDADDVLMPNGLSLMHKVAVHTKAEVVACNAWLRSEEENGSVIRPGSKLNVFCTVDPDFLPQDIQVLPPPSERKWSVPRIYARGSIYTVPWGKLYLREFLLNNRIFFCEKHIWGEDALFMFPTLLKAERYAIMTKPFYIYRIHKDASSHGDKTRSEEFVGYLVRSAIDSMRYFDKYEADAILQDAPQLHEDMKRAYLERLMIDRFRHFFAENFAWKGNLDNIVQSAMEEYFGKDAFFVKTFFCLANVYFQVAALQQQKDDSGSP